MHTITKTFLAINYFVQHGFVSYILMICTVYFASHRHVHVVKVCEFSGQIQMGGTNSNAEQPLNL